MQGIQYCNRLFAIEDSINKKYPGDYEKRKQLRLEKEKPILEAFWTWLDQQKPIGWISTDILNFCCSTDRIKIWPMNSWQNWHHGEKLQSIKNRMWRIVNYSNSQSAGVNFVSDRINI